MNKLRSLPNQSLIIILGLVFFLFLLHLSGLIDFREQEAIDLRFRLRGEQPAHSDITLVTIDDKSLAAIGQWPWPRSAHAVLLDVLSRYEPRLVFFDVLFTEQSPDSEEDDKLSYAVRGLGSVILSFYYHSVKPFTAFFPIEILRQEARGLGFVNVEPERDGVVRRVKASIETEQGIFYHPSLMIMRLLLQSEDAFQSWLAGLPVDRRNRFWIHYPGSYKSFQSVSFTEIIDAVGTERDAELDVKFRDKIILIGITATGATDITHTPFSTLDPGVVVQASAVHTLLSGRYLRKIPEAVHLILLLLFGLVIAESVKRTTPLKGLLFVVSIALIYMAVNIAIFWLVGWILPLFAPVIIIMLSYVLALFFRYIEILFKEEVIAQELKTASRIQENLLPQTKPERPHLDFASECRFAKQVGGDLYDWVPLEGGKLGVCVGDVSGKGVPAALYMARAISEFRRESASESMPGKICERMNNLLSKSGPSGMFLTMVYAIADPARRRIIFCSAGHEPMIVYRAKEKKAEIIEGEKGMPLGLFEGGAYESVEMPFQEGDVILMISDGVRELRTPKREELGMEKLRQWVEERAARDLNSEEMIRQLFNAMKEYQKGALPHDDRTLFCVKFSPDRH